MGSMNYFWYHLKQMSELIPDEKVKLMAKELSNVFRDIEKYQDGDMNESDMKQTVECFREKWI